jgi:hypothetical protein
VRLADTRSPDRADNLSADIEVTTRSALPAARIAGLRVRQDRSRSDLIAPRTW